MSAVLQVSHMMQATGDLGPTGGTRKPTTEKKKPSTRLSRKLDHQLYYSQHIGSCVSFRKERMEALLLGLREASCVSSTSRAEDEGVGGEWVSYGVSEPWRLPSCFTYTLDDTVPLPYYSRR